MKTPIILIIGILLVPLVCSLDDELAQSCGFDDELIASCLGDDELFFIGAIPKAEEIEEAIGHLGGTGLGTTQTEAIRKKADYPCPIDIPFLKRLFSTCKVPNNQICDDGEWLILDSDCKLDEVIFYQMWFLRTLLFIGFILFIKENRYFPVMVIILLVLFYMNGVLY